MKKTTSHPVASGLQLLLADTYALLANTHVAHWNIEGPEFFALHAAFQGQYTELFEAVDEIAERLRALGAPASGGLATWAQRAGIDEFPVSALTARVCLEGLLRAHQKAIADAAALRDAAGAANDLETQDLAIGRIQAHQKTAWMLRSALG